MVILNVLLRDTVFLMERAARHRHTRDVCAALGRHLAFGALHDDRSQPQGRVPLAGQREGTQSLVWSLCCQEEWINGAKYVCSRA